MEGIFVSPALTSLLLVSVLCKDQDHYVILGLGKVRYRASQQDIRKACKWYTQWSTCPVLYLRLASSQTDRRSWSTILINSSRPRGRERGRVKGTTTSSASKSVHCFSGCWLLPFYMFCLSSAYDILSNKKSRQAFDSVDPTFDDTIPPNNAHSRDNFFEVFGPVFSENER